MKYSIQNILHLVIVELARAAFTIITETIKELILAFLNTSPLKQKNFSILSFQSEGNVT